VSPVVIAGIAIMTIKKSSSARKEPTSKHTSAHHRFGSTFSTSPAVADAAAVIDDSCFIFLQFSFSLYPVANGELLGKCITGRSRRCSVHGYDLPGNEQTQTK